MSLSFYELKFMSTRNGETLHNPNHQYLSLSNFFSPASTIYMNNSSEATIVIPLKRQ